MPRFQLLPQFTDSLGVGRTRRPFHQDVDLGIGVKSAEGEIRAAHKQRHPARCRKQIDLGMKQDCTIFEHPQIGLARPEELYAVRMGLVEGPANRRSDLPLEALDMREWKTIPLPRVAAPGGSDMELAVLAATALKLARKA